MTTNKTVLLQKRWSTSLCKNISNAHYYLIRNLIHIISVLGFTKPGKEAAFPYHEELELKWGP